MYEMSVLTQFLCVQHSGCPWLARGVIAEGNCNGIKCYDKAKQHCASYA